MIDRIDIKSGSINFEDGTVLSRDTGLDEFLKTGIAIERKIDMKNGWKVVVPKRYVFFDGPFKFSLYFLDGKLSRVNFAAVRDKSNNIVDLKKIHDDFLHAQLGDPLDDDSRGTVYKYHWGSVTSYIDPRGGQSAIILLWN